ncbi:ABSCISIC ACID-INSENSITIVE 5-like protein 7 [Apium graveolens]|uniref:ABSCISIC ACID-INSENSITIVE 5-like protein 7 n=1 Tax=Apium graveolens TaxID=4045 RepID=UPI003D78CFE3
MSSYINFKNIGDPSQPEGSAAKPAGNFSLGGQSSVYSLTFDELQSTFSGAGKEFGSMNMDEFLKNIWTSDGPQPIASSCGFGEGILVASGNLQKQGSLTLPRTLSQKTVDEVLNLLKEGEKNGSGNGNGGANLPQRQGTLGEMTLEEFLSKAGVVGEATHPIERSCNGGFYGEVSQEINNNAGLGFGFQQTQRNHASANDQIMENNNAVPHISSNLAVDACSVMSQQLQQQQRQPPLFPKQATVAFSSPNNLVNKLQLASPGGKRGLNAGRADHSMSNSLVQSRVIQSSSTGMANLAPRVTTIAAGASKTQFIPNMIPKSDVDTSSYSPSPYAFNEGAARGKKPSGVLEKVVERRRKRMIKNRESAARSRARKQAYTLELEAEVAKLKDVIEDLQDKQKKFKDMQKTQVLEKMKYPRGSKSLCLRRTLTGPW